MRFYALLRSYFLPGMVSFSTLLLLTGCGVDPHSLTSSPASAHVHGHVMGGQQPVGFASLQLYVVGATGNGSASTPLFQNPNYSDSNGNFDITGDYSCPSYSSQIYLVATGGNPGLSSGTNNAALTLVNALGNCGDLPNAPYVTINEVTTVAAAYSLAAFAVDVTHIGAASGNSIGITNAMTMAKTIANSFTGNSPGTIYSNGPSSASFDSAKLYALADVISTCVNSDGTTPCATLFTTVTPTGGTAPTDTFQAALSIAHNPGNNVSGITNLIPPTPPFAYNFFIGNPTDWTLSVSANTSYTQPFAIAIDANGNSWSVDNNTSVHETSPQGALLHTFSSMDGPDALAIDSNGNVWVANGGPRNGVDFGNISMISVSNNSVTQLSATADQPEAVGYDPHNDLVWVLNFNNQQAQVLHAADGSDATGTGGYNLGAYDFSVAFDDTGDAYLSGTSNLKSYLPNGTVTMTWNGTGYFTPATLDSAGTLWASDENDNDLAELSPSGSITSSSITAPNIAYPAGEAIDAEDHIFVTAGYVSLCCSTFAEFAGTNTPNSTPGTLLSPSTGLGGDIYNNSLGALAVDASGNLWVGGNSLNIVIGIASPTATPIMGLPRAAGTPAPHFAPNPHPNALPTYISR
jgi:hypothetical protein